ncbi:hypothetical protein ACERII_23310 [Evansella sp. AB-rgal1]|uniref:hypothetical protein n=1 Tax=Evansella sp. AB-rgal1 TaxID=3242696 RepID=UPI00359DE6C4
MKRNYISFVLIALVVIIVLTIFDEPNEKSIDAQENTTLQETEKNLEYELLINEMKQENLQLRRNVRKLEKELGTFYSTVMNKDISVIEDAIHIIELFSMSESIEEAKQHFSANVIIHEVDGSIELEFPNRSFLTELETFTNTIKNLELRSFEIKEKRIILNYNYVSDYNDSIFGYSFVLVDENGWKIIDISN